MSTRTRILLLIVILIVASVVLQRVLPGVFGVSPPEAVSVRAEPVFHIDGSGIHLGPAHNGGFVITNAMLFAVLVTLVLWLLSWLATRNMYLVPRGLQNVAEVAVDGMYNVFGSVDRRYIARFWPLVGTIFFYVLFSNWLALIPGVLSIGYDIPEAELHHEVTKPQPVLVAQAGAAESRSLAEEIQPQVEEEGEGHTIVVPYLRSPSADLSNTFMLGIVAFFFIEYWGFKTLGLGYLYKFFPYKDGPILMIVGLLELISEFVRVVAFAFRLFGNIFAGEVLLLVMAFLFPLLPLPFIGFELFVGFIQAFIFAVLVMAFASMATQGHGDHAHEPHHAEVGGTIRQNPEH